MKVIYIRDEKTEISLFFVNLKENRYISIKVRIRNSIETALAVSSDHEIKFEEKMINQLKRGGLLKYKSPK